MVSVAALPCAYCYRVIKFDTVCPMTAVCGHTFHPDCAEQLRLSGRTFECPECSGDAESLPASSSHDNGKLWRTFGAGGDDSLSQQVVSCAAQGAGPPALAAVLAASRWRRVVQLELRCEDLSRAASGGQRELERERSETTRCTATELGLRRDMVSTQAQLDQCREQGLQQVVAHGASRCFAALLAAPEAQVGRVLNELKRSHGHALRELFAVQQHVLARMQAQYTARLGKLRVLRDESARGPVAHSVGAPFKPMSFAASAAANAARAAHAARAANNASSVAGPTSSVVGATSSGGGSRTSGTTDVARVTGSGSSGSLFGSGGNQFGGHSRFGRLGAGTSLASSSTVPSMAPAKRSFIGNAIHTAAAIKPSAAAASASALHHGGAREINARYIPRLDQASAQGPSTATTASATAAAPNRVPLLVRWAVPQAMPQNPQHGTAAEEAGAKTAKSASKPLNAKVVEAGGGTGVKKNTLTGNGKRRRSGQEAPGQVLTMRAFFGAKAAA